MSAYPPPSKTPSIFNPTYFTSSSTAVTTDYLNTYYLKKTGGTISGGLTLQSPTLTCNGGALTVQGSTSAQETDLVLAENDNSGEMSVRTDIVSLQSKTNQISRFTDDNDASGTAINGLQIATYGSNEPVDSYVSVKNANFSLIGDNSSTVLYADLWQYNTSGSATNRIGIKTTTPQYDLDVAGNTRSTTLQVTNGLTVDTNTLVVDATNNRVGINTTNPAYELDVTGAVNVSGAFTLQNQVVYPTVTTTQSYTVGNSFSLPSWATEVTYVLANVTNSNSVNPYFTLSPATSYYGSTGVVATANQTQLVSNSTGIPVHYAAISATKVNGYITFYYMGTVSGSHTWTYAGSFTVALSYNNHVSGTVTGTTSAVTSVTYNATLSGGVVQCRYR